MWLSLETHPAQGGMGHLYKKNPPVAPLQVGYHIILIALTGETVNTDYLASESSSVDRISSTNDMATPESIASTPS